jgi:transglutaminase-like putative cysteine protease
MGMYDEALENYLAAWEDVTNSVLEGKPDDEAMNELVAPNIVDGDGDMLPSPDLKTMTSYVRNNPDPTLTPTYLKLAGWNQRSYEIHRKYTTLPETITDRTREFAQTATIDLVSDYGKAIAIRDTLREMYPYTLVTPRLPEGDDFVDWFLFEQKSGYCTSYASAMVVLLRTLNIPSRYVEGYVLPEKGEKEETYRVTNRYAHAWAEVYFEGFGWMTFEPTPGFADTTDFLAQSETDMSGYPGVFGPTDLDELMRRYADNRNNGGLDGGGFVTGPVKEPVPPLTLALMTAGGALLLLILLNLLSKLSDAVAMRRTPDRRKVVLRYLRMMDWLKLAGMALQEGESLPEFSSRVDNEYYFPETSFLVLSAVFSRVRYGAKEPSLVETRMMTRMSHELRSQIVREIGIRRFMPLRHLFLRL